MNETNSKPTAPAPLSLTIKIVGSAFGRVPAVAVQTVNQASALYRAFISEHGYGASQAGRCNIVAGGKVVGSVSYNGRVWDAAGQEMTA